MDCYHDGKHERFWGDEEDYLRVIKDPNYSTSNNKLVKAIWLRADLDWRFSYRDPDMVNPVYKPKGKKHIKTSCMGKYT